MRDNYSPSLRRRQNLIRQSKADASGRIGLISCYAPKPFQVCALRLNHLKCSRCKPADAMNKKGKYFYKLFIIVIVALILSLGLIPSSTVVSKASNGDDSASDKLAENVENALKSIDFGDLDDIAKGLGEEQFNLFKNDSFFTKVGKILSGEFAENYPNMFAALLGLFGGMISDILPIIILIIAIGILCGFMNSLRAGSSGEGVRDVIHFVSYAAIIVLVLGVVMSLTSMTGEVLSSMKEQMDIVFPILLTLMAAIGGTASAGVFQPATVLLSGAVMQIFTYVVVPMFFITLVLSVVGNLSSNTRFDKFVSFFTSAFKWTVGIVFTVFLAILTVGGLSAATHDGISIRAAKLTISSYVPFLGGYISQGFDLVMASSVLIKNAVGVAGLYLLLGTVLGPVIKIVIFTLGLKLAAAVTQPVADSRISNFLTSVTKSFNMLLAILIGCAFVYFLTIGLVISTGNIF